MKLKEKTLGEKANLNQSIQLCKIVAAIFVVFIHVGFTGKLWLVVDCIARFAVPIFFAISGYFSYLADDKKVKQRAINMAKISIIGILIYLGVNIIETKYIFGGNVGDYLKTTFNLNTIAKWIFINVEPVAGHLWYLASAFFCYVILWIYVKFFDKDKIDYKPLYTISVCAFLIHVLIGTNSMAAGTDMSYLLYRNALFFGMPMFGLGIFLNEYKEKIISKYNLNLKKEVVLVIFGIGLSLLQYAGVGKTEMPLGMLFVVIGLMLFLVSHPIIPFLKNKNNIVLCFGDISLAMYIIHPLVNWFFKYLHGKVGICIHEVSNLNPLMVAFTSLIIGTIYAVIMRIIKKRKVNNNNKTV